MTSFSDEAPAPQFPSWLLNCLAFYCRLADDYARSVQALGDAATNPAKAIRAEEDCGASLMHDVMQAWYDLALSPLSAMAKVAAGAPFSAESASVGADKATAA